MEFGFLISSKCRVTLMSQPNSLKVLFEAKKQFTHRSFRALMVCSFVLESYLEFKYYVPLIY